MLKNEISNQFLSEILHKQKLSNALMHFDNGYMVTMEQSFLVGHMIAEHV